MVLPISGPFVKATSPPFATKTVHVRKQTMPIDRPLEYLMQESFGITHFHRWTRAGQVIVSPPTTDASFALTSKPGYSAKRTAAFNAAYAQLKNKVGDLSGWAENIATVNQSRRLLADSLFRIGSVVGSLRKGRFDEAAIACGLVRTPYGVSRRKHISQNFLAYEYGVKPLFSDVQSSMKLLTSDPGRTLFVVAKRELMSGKTYSTSSGGGFYGTTSESYQGTLHVRLQTYLRIHNPDLFLASKLGLIDLALPWKLIPFSFIVDWFVNVEDVISSLTDWYGCTLEHPFTTDLAVGEQTYRAYSNQSYWYDGTSEGNQTTKRQSSVKMTRTLGISGPTLAVKPFKGFSLQRGAQAVALVLSVFGK